MLSKETMYQYRTCICGHFFLTLHPPKFDRLVQGCRRQRLAIRAEGKRAYVGPVLAERDWGVLVLRLIEPHFVLWAKGRDPMAIGAEGDRARKPTEVGANDRPENPPVVCVVQSNPTVRPRDRDSSARAVERD